MRKLLYCIFVCVVSSFFPPLGLLLLWLGDIA